MYNFLSSILLKIQVWMAEGVDPVELKILRLFDSIDFTPRQILKREIKYCHIVKSDLWKNSQLFSGRMIEIASNRHQQA